MNTRRLIFPTAVIAVIAFVAAAYFVTRDNRAEAEIALAEVPDTVLVRDHSPIIGPVDAPVTIVEFFDPSCETCRAFYPLVKDILATYPTEVRLVIRYAAFHQGSDEAVRILEAARAQGRYETVLEAILAQQPAWAVHGAPNLSLLWGVAVNAGLDLVEARRFAEGDVAAEVLRQDTADVNELQIAATPTFFINGQPLASFGTQQLIDAVRAAVDAAR